MLNKRAESALDDIIAARSPGMNDISRLALKMMVMDLLFLEMWKQCNEQQAISADMLSAWSKELASRTQAFMDTHGMIRDKQKMLGETAKQFAPELMQRFANRIVTPEV